MDDDGWMSNILFKPENGDSWLKLGTGSVTVSLHTDDPDPFAGEVREMRKIDGTTTTVFTTKPNTPISFPLPPPSPELLAEITALL